MKLWYSLPMFSTLICCVATAHGPQLQITNDGDKIATRQIFVEGPYAETTELTSVYVMPVLEDGGTWFTRPNQRTRPIVGGPQFYSGPGVAFGSQVGATGAFAVGEQFTLNFTAGLLIWDGSMFVDPGEEQVIAFRGSPTDMAATATTSDATPYDGLEFPEIAADYGVEAHASARFQFLGDGVDSLVPPDDGVYLMSMSISTSQSSVADSDEFYFVLNKNAPKGAVLAAVEALGVPSSAVQYVPEPSTIGLGLLVVAAAALITSRQR